jgi:hypothetical protein
MKKSDFIWDGRNLPSFIDRVNSKKRKRNFEAVSIDKVVQNKDGEYAVIIDRISQDVPLSCLPKECSIDGECYKQPFWWSADDKFFNNGLADTLGVPLPNTVLLPSCRAPYRYFR